QRRSREAGEIASLRNEVAELRAEADHWREVQRRVLVEIVAEIKAEIVKRVDQVNSDTRNQLFTLVERRFAELMGRVDAIMPDARSRAKGEFKFANERDEDAITELPNPLPPHRAIN